MKRFRTIFLCLILILGGSAAGLTSAVPASAVTCYGDYCSGQDPHATGCDSDAYTLASANIPSTQSPVELRWSPTCKTEWARVPASWGTHSPGSLEAVQSTGYKQVGVVASNSSYSMDPPDSIHRTYASTRRGSARRGAWVRRAFDGNSLPGHRGMSCRSGGNPVLRKTRVVLTSSLLLLGMGAASAASAPAASAVTCYGDYCSGQDPHATGCDADAYTVASIQAADTGLIVELRWSPTCKTNWARVGSSWGTSDPSALYAEQPSTGYKQVGVAASNSNYSWSRMIYSPTLCVFAAFTGPGPYATSCV